MCIWSYWFLDMTIAGALSEVQIGTSGPMVGNVSGSVTLMCHICGVPITDSSYAWDWIRQTAGRDLQHIALKLPFMGLQHMASCFQTRVTRSANPSRNQLSLEVLLFFWEECAGFG
uniref:Uncharacterized protein n=1 Tax=Falco tinnunculus TaxID=100819 RepID=A0A8C4TUH9_FALTI